MSTAASSGAGAPQSTGTAGGSTGQGSSTGLPAAGWGDDWRTRLAAGSTDSEKELAQLQRYESPEQVWRKARELEKRLSSGELRSTLQKNATPDEISRWRAENGIPAKPEDYRINLPAGQKPPADDDQFLKAFLKNAHEENYTQAQVDRAVASFYAEVDRQTKAITEGEKQAIQATDEKLRQEWGADYSTNKQMAANLLARAPEGFRDRFLNGYLQDHTPIQASIEAWKWLVQLEREINPMATVVPGVGAGAGKAMAEELIELRKLMGDKNSKYWKGEQAESLQARYRLLLEAEARMKQKEGAGA